MKFISQHDQMDCGPACLVMISSFYEKNYTLQYFRENTFITREGVSMLGINEIAEKIGFNTFSAKLTIQKLYEEKHLLPCILHWNQNHFVVLKKITKSVIGKNYYFHIADPAHGFIKLNEENFKKSWLSDGDKGVALLLEPTEKFYELNPPEEDKLSIKYLFHYLKPYKKQLALMFLFLLLGSGLTLIFPFLTEQLIDKGVNGKDLGYISYILMAQLAVFLGSLTIGVFRNWLMLYVGTHLSITIITDFLNKMLKLPIQFFDTKLMGDFQQRIQDNDRIEDFLTSQSLTTFFSIITFSVFFGVLWYYDFKILIAYLGFAVKLKNSKFPDFFYFE